MLPETLLTLTILLLLFTEPAKRALSQWLAVAGRPAALRAVSVVVLVALLFALDPEVRVFFLFLDAIGIDIFLTLLLFQGRDGLHWLHSAVRFRAIPFIENRGWFPMPLPRRAMLRQHPWWSVYSVAQALLVPLVVLLGVLSPRTAALAATPRATQAVSNTAHQRAILDEFIEFLKIPNIASDQANIRRNAETLVAMMQHRGLSPQLLTSSRDPEAPPVVFGEWRVPKAKRTIVLYAHYDGQPVNPAEWATGPFTPTLRSAPLEKGGQVISQDSEAALEPETRLYARGSGDDKLGVMVILSALDALRAAHRTPTDNIKLVFEGEEEAGSPHLADILTEHRALLDSQLWVVCDGPVHPTGRKLVVYGARGDMNIDLTVYGPVRALHSGHYGNWAPNPAFNLARLLASMKDETGHVLVPGWYDDVAPLGELEKRAIKEAAAYDEPVRRELGLAATESNGSLAATTALPSLNINGMRSANVGAQAANVIPDSATAVLDVRLVLGNDPQRQFDKLLGFIRAKGYYVIDRPPTLQERLEHPLIASVKLRPGVYAAARAPMDDPLAHAIADAVRPSTDQPIIELPTSGGSLPLSIIQSTLGTRSIDVPTANYDDNQHAANENLRLGNLWEGINTYTALLTHRPPT